jgi:toxin ParE1/3/4
MKLQILRSPAARNDLSHIVNYLRQTAGPDVAKRFIVQVETALKQIATQPLIGSLWHSSNPELSSLRVWTLHGFPNHLLFYLPTEDSIELRRVIHGSRDMSAFLED